jgi:hypothetical protein
MNAVEVQAGSAIRPSSAAIQGDVCVADWWRPAGHVRR